MELRRFLLNLTIVLASVSLALGVIMPVMKLTKLYVWTDEHSMASIVWALYKDGEIFLSFVIGLFSIVLPVFKLVYLLAAASMDSNRAPGRGRWLKALEWLGKWSMLDVLVLALAIFYVKTSGLAEASAQPGIWFFAAAVVLTMGAHAWLKRS